jgi:hypothetical protein
MNGSDDGLFEKIRRPQSLMITAEPAHDLNAKGKAGTVLEARYTDARRAHQG